MYIAKHHEMAPEQVAEVLSGVRAGNLVTVHDSGPKASFVPFYVDRREDGMHLVTHLVRNNSQAVEPITGPALAIIDIDDAYVSPSWYATNEDLPNVPTWDYLTVHLSGPVRVLPDPDDALAAARECTLRMEPQTVLDALGQERLRAMARAIVGVDLRVERVEAKAKASQNRHPDDVRSLLEQLENGGETPLSRYIRDIALPHAEERFGTIERLRSARRGAGQPQTR